MTQSNTAQHAEIVTNLHKTINSSADLRRLLLDAAVALVEGRMNVQQANALVGLSAEVHKSIRQQFDMLIFASDHFHLGNSNQLEPTTTGEG